MSHAFINQRDLVFQLFECLKGDELLTRERFKDHSRETFMESLDTAFKLSRDFLAPHNRKNDLQEPQFIDGNAIVNPEVGIAWQQLSQAGLLAAMTDFDEGGAQLPHIIANAMHAMLMGANASTAGYSMLTIGNANLIAAHGNSTQKARYIPHLRSGRFAGTMCLSEPHAGSSLGDITTRAVLQADGTYRLFGRKMWISGGDQNFTENIVHAVLARIEGAPAGVKGISLFITPKFLVNADGSMGARNDIALAGLNHKMGYRGTTNCALNFGERDGAVAELVGQPNQGLAYMFLMMNEARIMVGLGATMLGYAGYLTSLSYAKERVQGKVNVPEHSGTPASIAHHPDVKRMLLQQKSYVEGALALCLYASYLVDDQHTAATEDERSRANALLNLLTPIVKAWPSEFCLYANHLAIQIHGGYGYTRDYPVEQFYRDNRLNPIHEGTNGIQGLDLLGRKIIADKGESLAKLAVAMEADIHAAIALNHAQVQLLIEPFASALKESLTATQMLMMHAGSGAQENGLEEALANSNAFLEMLGTVVIGWMWIRQACAAARALLGPELTDAENNFYQGKLNAAHYFCAYELSKARAQAKLIASLNVTCLYANPDTF